MHYGLPLDFCEIVSPFIQIFGWDKNICGWIFHQRDFILKGIPVVLIGFVDETHKDQEVQCHRNRTFYKQVVCRL